MEEPYLFLADIYSARKEFDRAKAILDSAQASLGSRESVLFKKISVLHELKDLDGVERLLRELLAVSESNVKALRMLRDVLTERRQWASALEIEKKLRKQMKTTDENQMFVGLQYERVKELFETGPQAGYDQIIKDIREITDRDKQFIPAYILAAEVYAKMGRLNDAGRVYGRGFSKTGHVVFLQKLEDLYVRRGEPGVVLKIYRRLLEVAPRNQFLIFLYARLCLKLEMIDEAIELLNSLVAEEREFQGVHRAMAEAYVHRGKYREAVQEFKKAFPMTRAYLPYYCEKCQSPKDEWTAFCETCCTWNTVTIRQEGLFERDAENLRLLYEHEQDHDREAS
jgi:tetratricopeptide (TPR) repeat protein